MKGTKQNSMRLNIGSHNIKLEGFLNVDILPLENVDIICDITRTPWYFSDNNETNRVLLQEDQEVPANTIEDNSVDEIVMVEVLEHISFHDTAKVLREIYRVLKPGGKLHIQVPAIDEMMKNWVNGEICTCIPHKVASKEPPKADPKCFQCEGRGKVNPRRWLMAFCGAQKDYGYGILPDIHKNIFTKEILEDNLMDAGFSKIVFKDDPFKWKIKVDAYK